MSSRQIHLQNVHWQNSLANWLSVPSVHQTIASSQSSLSRFISAERPLANGSHGIDLDIFSVAGQLIVCWSLRCLRNCFW
jgi:hypothetical protein